MRGEHRLQKDGGEPARALQSVQPQLVVISVAGNF